MSKWFIHKETRNYSSTSLSTAVIVKGHLHKLFSFIIQANLECTKKKRLYVEFIHSPAQEAEWWMVMNTSLDKLPFLKGH